MVVLEDVDLIARHRAHFQATPFLFELLNAMDGLDEDADLIFVLTTNRAKDLEPALASRPGRIDLAVELPLPDAHARRRLLALYGEGLPLEVADWEPVVAATEGTSPAFIRELFRRAALIAAEEDDGRERDAGDHPGRRWRSSRTAAAGSPPRCSAPSSRTSRTTRTRRPGTTSDARRPAARGRAPRRGRGAGARARCLVRVIRGQERTAARSTGSPASTRSSAATTSGSNCVPALRCSSAMATPRVSAAR